MIEQYQRGDDDEDGDCNGHANEPPVVRFDAADEIHAEQRRHISTSCKGAHNNSETHINDKQLVSSCVQSEGHELLRVGYLRLQELQLALEGVVVHQIGLDQN